MKGVTIGMGVAAVILGVVVFVQSDWAGIVEGLTQGGKMLILLSPMMVLAFAVTGFISVLISEETASRWLGTEAGWKGIIFGALAGAFMPGGPYVSFPLAATFLVSGAQIGPVVSFIAAKGLLSVNRLPMEVALLGAKLTFVRYVITLVFPFVLGVAANVFFSGYSEKIRSEIRELQKTDKI